MGLCSNPCRRSIPRQDADQIRSDQVIALPVERQLYTYGKSVYCFAIATESRSSGLIRCDWSSDPWSSCTQLTVPVNRLVFGV